MAESYMAMCVNNKQKMRSKLASRTPIDPVSDRAIHTLIVRNPGQRPIEFSAAFKHVKVLAMVF